MCPVQNSTEEEGPVVTGSTFVLGVQVPRGLPFFHSERAPGTTSAPFLPWPTPGPGQKCGLSYSSGSQETHCLNSNPGCTLQGWQILGSCLTFPNLTLLTAEWRPAQRAVWIE